MNAHVSFVSRYGQLARLYQRRSRLIATPIACDYRGHQLSIALSQHTNNNRAKERNAPESTASTAWIPPNRPLSGDKGRAQLLRESEIPNVDHDDEDEIDDEEELRRLEAEIARIEAEEREKQQRRVAATAQTMQASTDWLATRRSIQQRDDSAGSLLLKPAQGRAARQAALDLPVLPLTLLTRHEIMTCLTALGATDVQLILDNPRQPRMACVGRIVATGANSAQLQLMAVTVARQLRRRDLQLVGVVGAELGIEGDLDDMHEGWLVVDCGNYVVHVLDASTRQALQLEKLWSSADDPDGLYQLNPLDETAVDRWVENNPVPDNYGSLARRRDLDWEAQIKALQKTRYTAAEPPKPAHRQRRRRDKRSG